MPGFLIFFMLDCLGVRRLPFLERTHLARRLLETAASRQEVPLPHPVKSLPKDFLNHKEFLTAAIGWSVRDTAGIFRHSLWVTCIE